MPKSPAPQTCPTCKKPTQKAYKPFCSKRCADLDLGKWLDGAYVIAGASPFDSMADAAPEPSDKDAS